LWQALRQAFGGREEDANLFASALLYEVMMRNLHTDTPIFTADHQRGQDVRVLKAIQELDAALRTHRDDLNRMDVGELWSEPQINQIVAGACGPLRVDYFAQEKVRRVMAGAAVVYWSGTVGEVLGELSRRMRETIEADDYPAHKTNEKAAFVRHRIFEFLLDRLPGASQPQVCAVAHGLAVALLEDDHGEINREASAVALGRLIKKRRRAAVSSPNTKRQKDTKMR
jgi:hypothetical protein